LFGSGISLSVGVAVPLGHARRAIAGAMFRQRAAAHGRDTGFFLRNSRLPKRCSVLLRCAAAQASGELFR